MSLINKDSKRLEYKELKLQLSIAVEDQYKILKRENLQRLQKIGYVRPRTRLQQMNADDYMTDKQFANILGLAQVISTNPVLSDEYIYKFIKNHKISLKYLNHILKIVPDAITIIRLYSVDKVVYNYIKGLKQKHKIK